jgi:hypothetical protein
MVTAVSADFSQSAGAAKSTYPWIRTLPDLNRATHRRLGKSGAGWTFETICRLVHHIGRVGKPKAKKAAQEFGRLSVGLQAIANEAGISVAKVRRDLVKLVELGLVAVSRRNVTFKVDPATGKIRENRTGRSLPVVVFVTVGPEHCRTKAGQDRPAVSPSKLKGAASPDRDHSGGAIQRDLNTKRVPVGQAVGIGLPQAKAGRLPAAEAPGRQAGEAGGHPAAEAGHEGGTVRVDAAHDDLPPTIGRISRPAGPAAPPKRQTAGKSFAGHEPPARSAAEASAEWHRRNPERERQTAEYLKAKAAKAAKALPEASGTPPEAPPPATPPSTPFDLENARRAALEALRKSVPA